MARNDVQNQQLAEWLQLLGCPMELSPEDLQKLNTPSMRSVWRHLQRHVKPASTVRTIKKNLLLAKLETDGLLQGKFGKFKIETVQELVNVQKHSVTQKEIVLLREKIRGIDESLLSASSSLMTKITEKDRLINNLKEMYEKIAHLKLKLACLQREVEKLDKELEIANVLKKGPAVQVSSLELKENKLLVANFVQKFSSLEYIDDCIVEMQVSTSEFPPSIILDGILSVSNNALKTLNSSKISDICLLLNNPNKLNRLSFSKHWTNLNSTLYKNEREFQACSRELVVNKAELNKQRAGLCKVLEESLISGNSESCTSVELVDKLVENTLAIKREEKLKELLDEVQSACSSDFDQTKWMIYSYKEKEDGLLKEVNEKLSSINKLKEQISSIQVSFVKTEVLHRAKDLVSKFLNELKHHKDEVNQCQVLVSENLIVKEIEKFQKLPIVAMTRQWEDSFETIPRTVRDDMLKASESFNFLCQSEPKNLIKNIVEKTCWLNASQHQ